MATLYELPVIDAPDQIFTCSLNGRRCQFRLVHNQSNDRWAMTLWIDDVMVLAGKRVVTGCDLVGAYQFGIGKIVCEPWETGAAAATRTTLPSGRVRLFQVQPS